MKSMVVLTALATCAGSVKVAHADIVSSAPYALGGNRLYVQEGPPAHYFRPAFFDIFVEDWSWSMIGPPHPPPSPGFPSTGTSAGESHAVVTLNGLPPGEPVIDMMAMSFFDIFTEIDLTGRHVFDTEMLQMDLVGTVNGQPFRLRESPTLPSLGRYSVQQLPGGLYHIDSFFDVFTELSLDNGATWTPSEGATRFRIMPSPGAAALLALGVLAVGRRRR